MINFPNNFSDFLFTPNMDVEKSLLLKTADYCLAPLKKLTPLDEFGIGDRGFPRPIRGFDGLDIIDKWRKRDILLSFSPAPLIVFCPPLLKKLIFPFYLSSYFIFTFYVINEAKKTITYAWEKIDQQGPFLGSKLLKGVTLVMNASIPIFFGYVGLELLVASMGISLPVISLIAFAYLPIRIAAGVLLKLVAYNTDPKFKSAYHRYCDAKEANNLPQLLPQFKIDNSSNSNIKKRAVIKLKDKEDLGEFTQLSSDILEFFLSSYLPSQNLIRFRAIHKNLSVDISNEFILTKRIEENFSIDFINKVGLSYILKAMKDVPLDPYLKPRILGDDEVTFENGYQYVNIASSFEVNIKNKPITWGHESNETPKNESKLFLIFNQIKKNSFMELTRNANFKWISPDKYYMISAHENSEISWEQRSIKKINYRVVHFASPIYKVDDDHYSEVPLHEMNANDIEKTDFFKCLSTPESFAHI